MQKIILTIFTILSIFALYNYSSQVQTSNLRQGQKVSIHNIYADWKIDFGFKFADKEDSYRFNVFQQTYNYIQKRNSEEGYEMLGLNNYSALTKEEFREKYLIKKDDFQESQLLTQSQTQEDQPIMKNDVPVSVDWVAQGAVPAAVDSKSCNSSYAISSAAALSGIYQIKTGKLVQLSAQQFVSCDNYNAGCNGGSDYYSYLYAMENGVQSDAAFPYTGRPSSCVYDKDDVEFYPTDASIIHSSRPDVVTSQLAQQPLSAWIDADCDDFRSYRGGDKVFTGNFCQSEDVNYVVLLAGYNDAPEDDQKPYFIVQTSMGPRWGNEGYMYLYKKDKGSGALYVNRRVRFPSYDN